MSTPLFSYLLRHGDNALILAQQLAAWTGKGPILEEDLALANVSLDLLGEARLWLSLAGELEGRGRDEDALAMRRDAAEFRNLLLVEQPNGDFADTMVRQFLFDAWHLPLMRALTRSSDTRIAEIARGTAKEAAYHLERSREWVIRLGDGTEESHQRSAAALNRLWPYTGELFESDAIEAELASEGLATDPAVLRLPWRTTVLDTLAEATLDLPMDAWMQSGGRSGRHGEHLSYLLGEMQYLERLHPGLKW
ncbi:ring-1,2-phenylacetyl-CoA epoxidase subunit PaaC [Burkholderiales bacterium]|nr:MAG: phenylacetate-CoA oxygenase subunit PaaC [Burkholderiales bacterium]CAG0957249.1 ring-1,2-phenylacetyl-CoA epoxidase subunit PaaC [Burkholderiales bacterium]